MTKNKNSTSRLGPIIEKVEKLTRPQRIGIYIGVLVAIIGLATWLSFWPKMEEIDRLEKQLVQVQAELATAKKNAGELNDWRNQMKKKEAEYLSVKRELPDSEEIPTLLSEISKAGREAGLDFLLFQPRPENVQDFYAEIPVDINVSGSYHEVALFFDKVSNLHRIVNMRDIRMSPQSRQDISNDLVTICQAVTYKFVESAGQQSTQGRQTRRQ